MNGRLLSLHESERMVSEAFAEDDAGSAELDRIQERKYSILRSAESFRMKVNKGDKIRAPYIFEKQTSTLKLVDQAISSDAAKAIGGIYWRSMSAVAHSQAQGLMSHIQIVGDVDSVTRGDRLGQVSVSARDLALRNLGMILCASAMMEEFVDVADLEAEALQAPTVGVLQVWGRVADVPYPGPGR